jgi:acyl-coenzyme A thioesterase PaaI-like protein
MVLYLPIYAMRELPHTHGCFVCGESNALGLKLRFETDGKIVRTRFTPRREHSGFRETTHGGLIATVLDEIMVWACAVQARRFAFCAELNVRFLQPLRPAQETVVVAELVTNRRNRLFEAKAEMRSGNEVVHAMAWGKYLPIKQEQASVMLQDLVGDLSAVIDR